MCSVNVNKQMLLNYYSTNVGPFMNLGFLYTYLFEMSLRK